MSAFCTWTADHFARPLALPGDAVELAVAAHLGPALAALGVVDLLPATRGDDLVERAAGPVKRDERGHGEANSDDARCHEGLLSLLRELRPRDTTPEFGLAQIG